MSEVSPKDLPLPPGPPMLRRLGYLGRFAVFGDKEAILADLVAKYGDVVHVPPYVVLAGSEALRLVTSHDPALRTWPNDDFPSLASMDGDAHVHDRKQVMAAFTPRFLAGYVPVMRDELRRRMRAWKTETPLDLFAEMSALALDTLLRTMLGLEAEGAETKAFVRDYWTLIDRAERGYLPWKKAQVGRAKARAFAFLSRLVAERRRSSGSDALSAMVSARTEGEGISDEALVRYAFMLMDFGQGDIAIYLTYALAKLAEDPAAVARLRREELLADDEACASVERKLPLTISFLREIERLYPPVTDLHRELAADVAFSGFRLPKGAYVVVPVDLAHRSSKYFVDPQRFDPDRFLAPRDEHRASTLLPFGSGRHMCVAAVFSRIHACVVLHELLRGSDLGTTRTKPLPPIDYRHTLQKPSEALAIMVRPRPAD